MITNEQKTDTSYFLPEDGHAAKSDLLEILNDDDILHVYICAYNFSQEDLFKAIEALDARNIPVDALVDNVQAHGPSSWKEIIDLYQKLKFGTITLTTAGVNSDTPGNIWHSKALTIRYKSKPPCNWMGSVNFSDSGFSQGNTARKWIDQEWSDYFINFFNTHRDWALKNKPEKQIDYILKNPVTTDSIEEFDEENEVFIGKINKLEKELYKWKLISTFAGVVTLISLLLLLTFK